MSEPDSIYADLRRVCDDLLAAGTRLQEFYEGEEVGKWLSEPHPQLNGKSAFDAIKDGETQSVMAIIDRLESCAYL